MNLDRVFFYTIIKTRVGMVSDYLVRRMEERHIEDVVGISEAVFSRQLEPFKWVDGNFRHDRRFQYFVADNGYAVLGFILWREDGGHRAEHPVLVLETLGVAPECQRNGIGKRLIMESYQRIKDEMLLMRKVSPRRVEVTTAEKNIAAQNLYRTTLGAEIKFVKKGYFAPEKDEVVMVAEAGNGTI